MLTCFKGSEAGASDEVDDQHDAAPATNGAAADTVPDRGFLIGMDKFSKDLAAKKIIPVAASPVLASLFGPLPDEGVQAFSNSVYARCISTYPKQEGLPQRDGDPICDMFAVDIWEKRVLAAIADGCGWGKKPLEAARNGTSALLEYIRERHNKATSVGELGEMLLLALEHAHTKILTQRKNLWEIGTTTLSSGIVVELAEPIDGRKYAVVVAAVGDSKVFIYSASTQKAIDITAGNRPSTLDATDCGGRIGPQLEGGKPDLRNLRLYFSPLNEGDIVIFLTDGVHDNFDPQYLGLTPHKVDPTVPADASWTSVGHDVQERLKNSHREIVLTGLIKESNADVKSVLSHVIDHCNRVTQPSRDFLQVNSGKRLPVDYEMYPGKMDHTTCIIISVRPAYQP